MVQIHISDKAKADIQDIYRYLSDYDDAIAHLYLEKLDDTISLLKNETTLWTYFFITGAPFRAKLFNISRRTNFWIVYDTTEDESVIRIHRIWHSSQNPSQFSL